MSSISIIVGLVFGCLLLSGPVPTGAAQVASVPSDVAALEEHPLPGLAEVLARARERAPAVQVGRAAARVSEAGYAGARFGPLGNPYMELTADQGRGALANTYTAVTGVLWLPFELTGQRGSRIAEVDALVDWQHSGVERLRATVLGQAVRAYGRAVVEAARVRVLRETARVARAEADVYAARLDAADVTRRDAMLAQSDASRNEALLLESEGALRAALAEVSRVADDQYTSVVDPAPSPPPTPSSVWMGDGVQDAPLLEELEAEADFHAASRRRHAKEATGPINLMLIGGRGDLGEARVGAGLAYTFPVFRRNQAEQARAEAERARAILEHDVQQGLIESRLASLTLELINVREATELLTSAALPAARDAMEAAVATQQAGKGDILAVLMSRRDLAGLRLRRLELAEREWNIISGLVELTGVTP